MPVDGVATSTSRSTLFVVAEHADQHAVAPHGAFGATAMPQQRRSGRGIDGRPAAGRLRFMGLPPAMEPHVGQRLVSGPSSGRRGHGAVTLGIDGDLRASPATASTRADASASMLANLPSRRAMRLTSVSTASTLPSEIQAVGCRLGQDALLITLHGPAKDKRTPSGPCPCGRLMLLRYTRPAVLHQQVRPEIRQALVLAPSACALVFAFGVLHVEAVADGAAITGSPRELDAGLFWISSRHSRRHTRTCCHEVFTGSCTSWPGREVESVPHAFVGRVAGRPRSLPPGFRRRLKKAAGRRWGFGSPRRDGFQLFGAHDGAGRP